MVTGMDNIRKAVNRLQNAGRTCFPSLNVDENNSFRMSLVIDVEDLFFVTKKKTKKTFNLAFQ